ncbi:hypothetical protein BGZ60DRAFT_418842 [Tricladium varicosporioides]|nr:hypothetical protein BGZ60DRAFT_418842 [Hymenoscyphus varicosporioides]
MDWIRNRLLFQKYESVEFHEEDKESQSSSIPFISSQSPTTAQRLRSSPTVWMATTFLTTAICIIQFFLYHAHTAVGSFEAGFATDFGPAKHVVTTKRVLFEGSPVFYPNGTMHFPETASPKYVGEPSEEIDRNWDALTKNRYWVLSAEEARQAWGEKYTDFWDEATKSYMAGFDMQHTLHCLNFLRKTYWPEHYPMSAVHGNVHRDHCIDHLRQLVMCQGDITPVATLYRPGIERNYVESNRWHTCRDTSKILEWAEGRFHESQEWILERTNGEVHWDN